jgi:predicted extracellular nuclease
MRRTRLLALLTLSVVVSALVASSPQALSTGVVVSQVYGGGGNSGATFTHDFIELFNRGSTPVDVTGWSVQYASATGTGNFVATPLPSVTLAPGQYLLVQQAQGAGGTTPLPTPDATGTIAMAAGAGKVIVASTATALACNGGSTPCSAGQLASIVDLVGYGTANFFESAAAPTLTNTTAALRNANGCAETDNNAADFAAGAPDPRNTSSPTSACVGDTAPSVVSTTPAAGATEVAVDANVSVTFSEPVNASGSSFTLSCSSSGSHTATLSGGPTTFTLDPDTDFAGGESCTLTVVAAQVTDQDPDDPPDAMLADAVVGFTTVLPVTPIHDIQGDSHLSPLAGSVVKTRGIVTALRSLSGPGFYMQTADAEADADAATSEGIFVFTGGVPTVAVGDDVQVVGNVTEFRPGGAASTNLTTTELTSPSILVHSSGNALPAATIAGSGGRVPPATVIDDDATGDVETSGSFDEATDGIDFWESLEGMLLQVNDAVAVGPTNGFGEIPVVGDNGANAGIRTARGGVVISPTDFNPERILLDDTLLPVPLVNVGDGFTTPVVGVLDYSFANFKLNVTTALTGIDRGLTREVTAAQRKQQVAIATYNVENLDPGDGPAFAQHADYIVNHLRSPDVIAIEEIQDDDGATNSSVTSAATTWSMLVAAISAAGGPAYQYRQIDPVDDADGGEPGGNIRVGFLFRTDRDVEFIDRPGGTSTSSTAAVAHPSGPRLTFSPGRIDPGNAAWAASRKPLAGEFRMRGKKVIVIVNHFNSKGGDQPLFGRFQPPSRSSEVQRHAQAVIVNSFVDSILAGNPNANVVVLGDINDFEFSETVSILEGGVLSSLMNRLPKRERYSYVFEGNSQVLDQILVSEHLGRFSIDYDVVHVNSEFATQTSDHDPQVARIDLREKGR